MSEGPELLPIHSEGNILTDLERLPLPAIMNQHINITGIQFTTEILDAIPTFILIINKERQIVYSNKLFRDTFGDTSLEGILGKRPGEAIGCFHAADNNGCGTTEFCNYCGAAAAVSESQQKGSSSREAIIILNKNSALNVMIQATQKKIQDNEYTIFAMKDISSEKRKLTLERIFFHDLLNMTSSLKGYLEIIKDAAEDDTENYLSRATSISNRIIDEIRSQRTLMSAESGFLELFITPFSTSDFIEEIEMLLSGLEIAPGKIIERDSDFYSGVIETDKSLLKRVILNMGKNALEAINPGQKIKLGCTLLKNNNKNYIEFTVYNPSFIPTDVQLQLFQRSFSTKGSGRGEGTYSIKLLTENYLGGTIRFSSNEENGTLFSVIYPQFLEQN